MSERKTIFSLLIAAAAFRTAHFIVFANDLIPGSDQINNIVMGRRLAAGDFYGVLDTYWPPLYPILIGAVTFITGGLVLPAALISIFAGALAAPVIYLFVRQFYDRRKAVIAGALAIFFPHLINSTFAVGTENIYLLLMAGALIFGWRSREGDPVKNSILTGILLGLAYLTRPEAFGYPAFFILVILIRNWPLKKRFLQRSLRQIGALVLAFAILATPYLVYLRSTTGSWTVSGKVEINTIAGEYESPVAVDGDAAGQPVEEPVASIGAFYLKLFAANLIEINKQIPYLVPLLLLLLIGLGLFGTVWTRDRLGREMYLFGFCVVTALGYSAAVVQARYLYVLLPIFLGWIAIGIDRFEQWFRESSRLWLSKGSLPLIRPDAFVGLCLVAIYFYVLPLNFFMRSEEAAWQSIAYEERDAGLWLKRNGKPNPLVFTARMRPAFYAEGVPIPPVTKDLDAIVGEIRDRGVDYVITGDRGLKRNPFLKDLPAMLMNTGEFELVHERTDHPGYSISIFERKLATDNRQGK